MKTWTAKISTGIGGALALFTPVGRCPVCLSSTTGVAGAVGLGVLAAKPWFLPLIGVFLLLGLWGMISSARAHQRWQAVWATAIGAVLLIAGRMFSQTILLWISAGLLTTGLLLDLYWKRKLSTKLVRISGIELNPPSRRVIAR